MSDAASPVVKRRACVPCTAAKAKCTPHTLTLCQRCARLGKECTYLDLPQTRRKYRTGLSRVELLEKKIDQLNSQLAGFSRPTEQISPGISNALTNDSNPPTNNPHSSLSSQLGAEDISAMLDAANEPSHGRDPPTKSALEGQPSIVDRGILSEAEADYFLKIYQLELVPKFPFVLLAQGETVSRLMNQQPFLFLSIVSATMRSGHPLRTTVAEEIMKHVTVRVVVQSERNLELLQGLLVCSAWYSYPGEKHHPRLLLLVQFCVSILYDLGLHKKPDLNSDERQALLGTYWISVGLYGTLGRPITMKHDARMNQCLERIKSTEHLSDRWIAPFIHLQSFLATIDEVYGSMQASGGKALVQLTRSSLQRQFDIVKAGVEQDLGSCPPPTANAIRIEIKYVELRLEELSLHDQFWTAESDCAARISMLMAVIQRGKELIHAIISLPASDISRMTIPACAHICAAVGYMPSAVLILINIITSTSDSDVESQVKAVVDLADYPNLLTQLTNAMETQFEGVSAENKETDVVGSLCDKMRLLSRCYPYQIRAVARNAQPQSGRDNTAMITVDATDVPMEPQIWPSIYSDLEEIFPIDDTQWDSLLSNFTGFN